MSKYSSIFLLSNAEYENIGECLRLRKYGSWLAEETWKREAQAQSRAQFTLRAIALAKKIAIEKGISQDEAFSLLQGSDNDNAILSEYVEDTVALMSTMPSAKDQLGDLITAFFRNRGEVLQGKKWVATEDWDIEDTRKLPVGLVDQVEAFMALEDIGEAVEEEEEGEEEEKN